METTLVWRVGESWLCSIVLRVRLVRGGDEPHLPGRFSPRSTARARPGNRSCSCVTSPHVNSWRSASGPAN